jgi:hypothetical protein
LRKKRKGVRKIINRLIINALMLFVKEKKLEKGEYWAKKSRPVFPVAAICMHSLTHTFFIYCNIFFSFDDTKMNLF